MKMRKFISIVVLAVYSIVMAHSFIPHHHHSEFIKETQICEHAEHDVHHEHEHEFAGDCCVNQEQDYNSHKHCSFDEITILAKSLNLSNLHLPSTEIEFSVLEKIIQSVSGCYIPIQISSPHCRDVQLRGPPHFS